MCLIRGVQEFLLYSLPMRYTLPIGKRPLFKATFLSRPNRFLVWCEEETRGVVKAFLPNPGRLSELLFPGVILYVLDNSEEPGDRATQFTVIAVERDGAPVMLHTHWCNDMVQAMLARKAVPGLEHTRLLRREVKVGHSRFDFLLEDNNGEIYLEVKSCTLFGNGVAMFPDAITERGRRHLLELAELAAAGQRCYVLFVVQTQDVQYFMPDYHTDLDFAQTMLAVRESVRFMALPVSWSTRMTYYPGHALLEIPWEFIAQEAQDRGAYLALFHAGSPLTLSVGGLGDLSLAPGYYTYVGSAMRGLDARVARHRRKRKRMHWHVDYLRAATDVVEMLAIRSSHREECEIANDLGHWMTRAVPGFGCSDCDCETHLFYSAENPLEQPAFHDWLQTRRMPRPA